MHVSISPTFYEQLFGYECALRTFYVLTFCVFHFFLAKGNRQKAIRKLLVKLTTRVIRVVKDDLVGRHLR